MRWVGEVFDGLGVTGQDREPAFPDGAAFRIEIPSVEGPRVLEAVLRAAEAEGITVNRVSQGSGAMLLRASELRDMAQAGLDAGVEVCLFVGPRERFGTGAHVRSADGRAHGDQVRGLRQMAYALEDVLRATEEGIRSFLVADLVRAGAPLYAKFGLRNAQAIYPSGHHLEAVACANATEKVHRAAVALEWLERLSPGLVQSKPGAAGLGLPVR